MASYKTLKVIGERLNSTLQSTCSAWGAISNSMGMRQLALSHGDKRSETGWSRAARPWDARLRWTKWATYSQFAMGRQRTGTDCDGESS